LLHYWEGEEVLDHESRDDAPPTIEDTSSQGDGSKSSIAFLQSGNKGCETLCASEMHLFKCQFNLAQFAAQSEIENNLRGVPMQTVS
jgi:hypothetical protein